MSGLNKMSPKESRTVIFIDGDNLYYSAKSLGRILDFAKFHDLLIQTFGESALYYYLTVDPTANQQIAFLRYLQRTGYRVKSYPLRKIGESVHYTSAIDVQLAVDAVSISQYFDKVVIVSGDRDFVPLLRTLKELGRKVIVLSLPIVTSIELRQEADQFLNLEELFSRLGLPPEAIPKARMQTIANDDAIKVFYLEKGLYFHNYIRIRKLLTSAKGSITIIDNYINEDVLYLVSILNRAIQSRIITKRLEGKDFFIMVRKLKREGRDIDVYRCEVFHDRFIRIDDEWWHLGHSIKDLGSGNAMIMKISELSIIAKLQEREKEVYRTNKPMTNWQ